MTARRPDSLRQTASGGGSHGYQLGCRDLVGNGLTIRPQDAFDARVNQWLAGVFAPARLTATIDEIMAGQQAQTNHAAVQARARPGCTPSSGSA